MTEDAPAQRKSVGEEKPGPGLSVAQLQTGAVQRQPLGDAEGYSGASLERLTLADGSTWVLKHISPANDIMMRLTHDTGRAAELWIRGVLRRVPPIIDTTVVAVEPEGDGWVIVMRDVSPALLGSAPLLSRGESRRLLAAATALHGAFLGEQIPGLCTLTDRYSLCSPTTAAHEAPGPNQLFSLVARGWERFADVVPHDVGDAIFAVLSRPELLATQMHKYETSLIHGDLWVNNLGLRPDSVIMLDWGYATQAPLLTLLLTSLAISSILMRRLMRSWRIIFLLPARTTTKRLCVWR